MMGILLGLLLVGALGWSGDPQGLATLSIRHTVDPQRIFVQGSGVDPETAAVTLQLEAPRRPDRFTADVMLVLDRSASFPIEQAVDAAERVIERLGPSDRVGVVSFATEARLDARLTPVSQADSVREALQALITEGKTALGEGIAVATDELLVSGRPDALQIEILLTDGRSNFGRDPLEEAGKAADQGIVIYSVGVGRFVNRDLLTQIAEVTGGQFFPAFSDAIVDQILRAPVADSEPVIQDIEIVETLDRGLEYDTALRNPPTRVTPNFDGTTTLTWQLDSLREGEIWRAQFTVRGRETGFFSLTASPSHVSFTDLRGRRVEQDLPFLSLEVRPTPPRLTPDFRFTPTSPTRFDEIQFTDESTVESGQIVSWLWEFGDGTFSSEPSPTHRYRLDGDYTVKLTVTSDQGVEASVRETISVRTPPQAVEAAFTFTPSEPTRLDDIQFTDETVLSRGEIVSWLWEFGDGTTSSEQNPTHRYPADGEYTVKLTVVSDEGVQSVVSQTIRVFTPKVTVRREINTYIPIDQTIPGETFQVTVTIRANTRIHGLGLDENVPESWAVKPLQNSTAELRSEDLQWLFSETLEPGTEKTIVYEVKVPTDAKPGMYRIDGTLSSASPQLSLPVDGDIQIEILSGFPIAVVVSHWDVNNNVLDLQAFPAHKIDLNQILKAISWWREGVEIPFSEDENGKKSVIDFKTIQELVAYWLTDTSVFEPLPQEDEDES
jgi:PKD repeat protein